MDADHSVELGPSAPALEIPWRDPTARLHYVDLRSGPDSVERNVERNAVRIPEARQFPALRGFLIALNSQRSPWQTAKCDVWRDEAKAAENLYGAGYSQGCYVDIVLAEQTFGLRDSLEVHQRAAKEIAQLLEGNAELEASAEIVVRRCYFHRRPQAIGLNESEAGYCLTLFLTGYGASSAEAAGCWEQAIGFAAECWLRLKPH